MVYLKNIPNQHISKNTVHVLSINSLKTNVTISNEGLLSAVFKSLLTLIFETTLKATAIVNNSESKSDF